jgi:hypothetical protein
MSKLDSGLFVMTPVDVPLQSMARDAVKMFEGEAKAAGIALEYHAEDSCSQANVEYVSLDPTRVLQILIVSATDERPTITADHVRTSSPTLSNLQGSRTHGELALSWECLLSHHFKDSTSA